MTSKGQLYKEEYKLTFITPCVCAGANPKVPEIRAASIRGQLRWWFRSLGTSLVSGFSSKDEIDVFGGVGKEAVASKLVVRVSNVDCQSDQYTNVLTRPAFRIGTSFLLSLELIREIEDTNRFELLKKAIQMFLYLGSIGAHATRGYGCFVAEAKTGEIFSAETKIVDILSNIKSNLPSEFFFRGFPEEKFDSAVDCRVYLEKRLKEFRKRFNLPHDKPSALGYITKGRESSALKLRPIQDKDGVFIPCIYYTDAACSQTSIKSLLGQF